MCCAHLARVVGEERLARRFIRRFKRSQIRVERSFRIDDDEFSAGQADDDVGAHPAVVVRDRLLLFEVAVLDHPRELDDAFQLELAPPASNAWALEGVHEPGGFGPEVLPDGIERRDARDEIRARGDTAMLGFLDLGVHAVERLLERREQIFDGPFARVDVRRGFRPRFAQPRLGEVKKRLVVRVQSLRAEGLERGAKIRFRLALRGRACKPAEQAADGQRNQNAEGKDGRDGH